MPAIALMILLAVVTLLLATIAFALARLGRLRRVAIPASADVDTAVVRVARYQRGMTWASVPAALLVATATVMLLEELAVYLVPTLFILVLMLSKLLGEVTAPRPAPGPLRIASLRPRDPASYVSARRIALMRGLSLAAAVLGIVGIIRARPDGRSLGYACDGMSGVQSPWPGFEYTAPALAVLAAGVLLAEVTLRRVATRPRIGGDPVAIHVDELLRSTSAQATVRGATLMASLLAVGLAGPMALMLHRVPCSRAGDTLLVVLLFLAAIASAVAFLALLLDAVRDGATGVLRKVAGRWNKV
ncbi:hypothetical protein [Carbonactinospora thermoautotrophica]|uniref:hypothetical protein n=2 Tax=Carbonactinospora thermoautotrophica TaxID=1469144 RepID=UPI000829985B|nr:hypothetical protein [Carbonactinospora thermoautotrophica]